MDTTAAGRGQTAQRRLEWPIALLLMATVCLTPIWYGGVGIWTWALTAIAAGLLALGLIADRALSGQPPSVPLNWLPIPSILVLAVLTWTALQTLNIIPQSWHHPIWTLAREALGSDLPGAITLNTEQTWLALLRALVASVVFWLALQLGRRPHTAMYFLGAIALCVSAISIYGLADLVFDWRMVLFTPKDPHVVATYGNYVSATFINRNHYAAFAGIGLIILTALFMREASRALDQSTRTGTRLLALVVSRLLTHGLPLAVLALPIALGLALSGSRAGLATTFAGMMVVVLLYAVRASNKLGSIICALSVMLAVILLADSFGDTAARRLDTTGSAFSTRLAAFQITLQAALANPWFGFGNGTFMDLFPLFRDGSVGYGGIWNAAHNSYLETMATLGLPAAVAIFVALLAITWRCFCGAIHRYRSATAPIVAVAVSVQLALHSAVDFPLQTGAIAILFAVVLGVGMAQSWSSRRA